MKMLYKCSANVWEKVNEERSHVSLGFDCSLQTIIFCHSVSVGFFKSKLYPQISLSGLPSLFSSYLCLKCGFMASGFSIRNYWENWHSVERASKAFIKCAPLYTHFTVSLSEVNWFLYNCLKTNALVNKSFSQYLLVFKWM